MQTAQEILSHFQGPLGYTVFFLLVTACGCGFPFNSDITLIAAAVLSATGDFQISVMLVLAVTAILAGDSICFFVARHWGVKVAKKRPLSWVLSEARLESARISYARHGRKIMFTARFIPLVRSAFFFTAGTLGVSPRSFYLMNGLATLIYVPILMLSSYYLSRNIEVVLEGLKHFQIVVVVLLTALLAWRLAVWKMRESAAPPATPLSPKSYDQ